MNLGEDKAGCAQRLLKKKWVNSDFAMQSGASESATVSMFCYSWMYLLLTVQMWILA